MRKSLTSGVSIKVGPDVPSEPNKTVSIYVLS